VIVEECPDWGRHVGEGHSHNMRLASCVYTRQCVGLQEDMAGLVMGAAWLQSR
jgi:hypothetical protein